MLYVPLCKLARALHRPPLTSLISVIESIGNSRRLLRAVSEALERSFYAIGHGLLIPLFFVSLGLSSDYHALAGHWTLMFAVIFVVVVGKVVGCGLAAVASEMGWVRSRHDVAAGSRPDRYCNGREHRHLQATRCGGHGRGR